MLEIREKKLNLKHKEKNIYQMIIQLTPTEENKDSYVYTKNGNKESVHRNQRI